MQDFLSSNRDGYVTFYIIAYETTKVIMLQWSCPTPKIAQKFKDEVLIPLNWFLGVCGVSQSFGEQELFSKRKLPGSQHLRFEKTSENP